MPTPRHSSFKRTGFLEDSENRKHESDESHDCYFFKWQDPYTVAPDRRVDGEDQLISVICSCAENDLAEA